MSQEQPGDKSNEHRDQLAKWAALHGLTPVSGEVVDAFALAMGDNQYGVEETWDAFCWFRNGFNSAGAKTPSSKASFVEPGNEVIQIDKEAWDIACAVVSEQVPNNGPRRLLAVQLLDAERRLRESTMPSAIERRPDYHDGLIEECAQVSAAAIRAIRFSAPAANGAISFTIPCEPRREEPCVPDIHPSAGGGRICRTCTGFGVDGQPLRCVRTGKNADESGDASPDIKHTGQGEKK